MATSLGAQNLPKVLQPPFLKCSLFFIIVGTKHWFQSLLNQTPKMKERSFYLWRLITLIMATNIPTAMRVDFALSMNREHRSFNTIPASIDPPGRPRSRFLIWLFTEKPDARGLGRPGGSMEAWIVLGHDTLWHETHFFVAWKIESLRGTIKSWMAGGREHTWTFERTKEWIWM